MKNVLTVFCLCLILLSSCLLADAGGALNIETSKGYYCIGSFKTNILESAANCAIEKCRFEAQYPFDCRAASLYTKNHPNDYIGNYKYCEVLTFMDSYQGYNKYRGELACERSLEAIESFAIKRCEWREECTSQVRFLDLYSRFIPKEDNY